MKISFYNGVSGLMAYQEDMDRISHNIANTNTVGYKPSKSGFSDLLYTRMAVNSEEEPLTGHGVKIEDSRLIYRPGAVIQTNSALDFALIGDGLFAVECADGSTQYTRNGAFDISVEGSTGYLVTSDGSYVLDSRGQYIEVEGDSGESFDLTGIADQIGIYDFPNPFGLETASGSRFKETELSGEAMAITGRNGFDGRSYRITSGALEQSAVELSDEMVNVIATQKAFQFSAKIVQTADELEQVINNLR